MNNELKLKALQNIYAMQVASSVVSYEKMGVLERIVAKKSENGASSAAMFQKIIDAKNIEDVFIKTSELFGCANWEKSKDEENTFVATNCKLCAFTKQMGGGRPCEGWCLNPMKDLINLINSDYEFITEQTLYDGEKCKVKISL